jgi:hypothetical protein
VGGIGNPEDGIIQERSGHAHTIRATKSADFAKYFDNEVDKIMENHLAQIGNKKWAELENHRTLRKIRLHNFKPVVYAIIRYLVFHHYITLGNSNIYFSFEYDTRSGQPICAINGCRAEPVRVMSKITQSHLILYGVIICAPHSDLIGDNHTLFHNLIDSKIFKEIKHNTELCQLFPEYVAMMRD